MTGIPKLSVRRAPPCRRLWTRPETVVLLLRSLDAERLQRPQTARACFFGGIPASLIL